MTKDEINEYLSYKPYTIKRVGRVWFSTVYGLYFEETLIRRSTDYQLLKEVMAVANGAYSIATSNMIAYYEAQNKEI